MQSEMDFGVYATTSCNHARRKNAPPEPDGNGLFDRDGVTVICGRRQCDVVFESDICATVVVKDKKTPLVAMAPDRWHPVEILKACAKAQGRVESIAEATGSRLADIPVDNSTGNFIKVRQRLPVRIVLLSEARDTPWLENFRAGMNAQVRVASEN